MSGPRASHGHSLQWVLRGQLWPRPYAPGVGGHGGGRKGGEEARLRPSPRPASLFAGGGGAGEGGGARQPWHRPSQSAANREPVWAARFRAQPIGAGHRSSGAGPALPRARSPRRLLAPWVPAGRPAPAWRPQRRGPCSSLAGKRRPRGARRSCRRSAPRQRRGGRAGWCRLPAGAPVTVPVVPGGRQEVWLQTEWFTDPVYGGESRD